MNEAIYNSPRIDGYYWYFEENEKLVIKLEHGLAYFCGKATPVKVTECPGEFHKIPEPG